MGKGCAYENSPYKHSEKRKEGRTCASLAHNALPVCWAQRNVISPLPVHRFLWMQLKDHPASLVPAPHHQWPPFIVRLLNKGRIFFNQKEGAEYLFTVFFLRRKSSKNLIKCIHGGVEEGMATHSSTLAWRIPWAKDLAGYSP